MKVMVKPSFTATVQARGKKGAYSLVFCLFHGTARQTGWGELSQNLQTKAFCLFMDWRRGKRKCWDRKSAEPERRKVLWARVPTNEKASEFQ